jgi:predicted cupin superfamily sugar epimerase
VSARDAGAPPAMPPRAADLVRQLDLRPHPEGGWYRELFRSDARVSPVDGRGERAALTTIYFLLVAGTASRWHRVTSDEVWHLYEGGPLELLELSADASSCTRHVLAPLVGGGSDAAPVRTIPSGAWQAARPLGEYALVGCTVGPGFDFDDFTMLADDAATARLVAERWPDLAGLTGGPTG